MSKNIKEAVSIIVVLALVAIMQYYANRACCRPVDFSASRAAPNRQVK